MKKLWVKSSKKKQRLYEKTVKNRNAEKELDYKQYKALLKSLKNQRKTVTKILLIHVNILLKTWDVMKEIIGNKRMTNWNKRITNVSLPNFITVKNR